MGEYISLFKSAFSASLAWFTAVMDMSEVGPLYLACVFIAMTSGFLLANFGSAFRRGSDMAAKHYGKRRDDL